jgi:1,6-anhydro-N-acetylmuramate kinase
MKKIALKISHGPHLAVGLMSGTSHDGVSAALIRIDERRHPAVELLAFKTYPHLSRFRARLLAAEWSGRPRPLLEFVSAPSEARDYDFRG